MVERQQREGSPTWSEVLEESPLMLLLVDHDLDVYMIRDRARNGTAIDSLQPLVTVVFFSMFVVFTLERGRGVNPLDTVRAAPTPTQKVWMFATALEQVCQGTTLDRIQVHHPPQGTPRLSWEKSEDRICTTAVVVSCD